MPWQPQMGGGGGSQKEFSLATLRIENGWFNKEHQLVFLFQSLKRETKSFTSSSDLPCHKLQLESIHCLGHTPS